MTRIIPYRGGLCDSKDIVGIDLKGLAVFSNVLLVLVSIERLPHVQRIFSVRRHARGIVRVVPDHPAIRRVAHAFVHLDGVAVAHPHKEIHEPRTLLVACLFQRLAQQFPVPQPSVLRRDGQRRDVAVPW